MMLSLFIVVLSFSILLTTVMLGTVNGESSSTAYIQFFSDTACTNRASTFDRTVPVPSTCQDVSSSLSYIAYDFRIPSCDEAAENGVLLYTYDSIDGACTNCNYGSCASAEYYIRMNPGECLNYLNIGLKVFCSAPPTPTTTTPTPRPTTTTTRPSWQFALNQDDILLMRAGPTAEYGLLCDSFLSSETRVVFCNELGYTGSTLQGSSYTPIDASRKTTLPYVMAGAYCASSSATSFQSCSFVDGSACNNHLVSKDQYALRCDGTAPASLTRVRTAYADGSSLSSSSSDVPIGGGLAGGIAGVLFVIGVAAFVRGRLTTTPNADTVGSQNVEMTHRPQTTTPSPNQRVSHSTTTTTGAAPPPVVPPLSSDALQPQHDNFLFPPPQPIVGNFVTTPHFGQVFAAPPTGYGFADSFSPLPGFYGQQQPNPAFAGQSVPPSPLARRF